MESEDENIIVVNTETIGTIDYPYSDFSTVPCVDCWEQNSSIEIT